MAGEERECLFGSTELSVLTYQVISLHKVICESLEQSS